MRLRIDVHLSLGKDDPKPEPTPEPEPTPSGEAVGYLVDTTDTDTRLGFTTPGCTIDDRSQG